MSPWIGLVLFVLNPLLGGVLWLLARIEAPTGIARAALAAVAALIGLELAQLLVEPVIRVTGDPHFLAEFLPITLFNWTILVLPIVVIDVLAIGLALQIARTPPVWDLSFLEAGRLESRRRRLSTLALGKVVSMAALLGSALGLFFVAIAAALPYVVLYLRSRQAELFWWLALTIHNRLDPAAELAAFAETRWGNNRQRLRGAAASIRSGEPVIDALIMHRLLGGGEIVELRVADAAGALEEGLRNCAERYSSSSGIASLSIRANGAILWLWAMTAAIASVLGFLTYSILPKYKAIFADFGMELPETTRRLVGFSGRSAGEMAAMYLSLFVITGWLVVGSVVLCVGWQNLQWSWLQQMFPRRDAPVVMHYLTYLIRAGWPAPQAVQKVADEALRDDLRERLNRVNIHLEAGDDLGVSLEREGYLRPVEAAALAAGQRAGHLAFALESLAESLNRQRVFRFQGLVEILKPVFLLILAALVAVTAVAMFVPIVRIIEGMA